MATLSNLDTSASVYQSSQLLNWVYLNLSPNDNGNQMPPTHTHTHTQQTPQQITTAAIPQNGNYGNTGDLWINPQNTNLNHLNVSIIVLIILLLLFLGIFTCNANVSYPSTHGRPGLVPWLGSRSVSVHLQ